ncbi:MAG: DUF368 domain-containing protein [Treponema sp.]|nr:DUF368 domain-containing protein [Treponema sp.]MCL2237399.1 DUF368 domain-containing protein [Treponema sp.]
MEEKKENASLKNAVIDWFLRFLKGAAIGMDFVLPGISGAALAVVFGLYERIVSFIANITKDFVKNVLFFIPVGIGGLLGIYLVSHPISFLQENYLTPFLWFFVGAILGTMPELWRKSGANGRKPIHIGMSIFTFILAAFVFLAMLGRTLNIEPNPIMAFFIGAAVALIVFIPGFSSSTFLVLVGLYESVIHSYKNFSENLSFLIPFALGMLIFVFPFSKGIQFLIKKTYTGFYHIILGFVLASAVLIAAIASGWQQEGPNYNYLQIGSLACAAALIAGAAFSYWMCNISKKYEES